VSRTFPWAQTLTNTRTYVKEARQIKDETPSLPVSLGTAKSRCVPYFVREAAADCLFCQRWLTAH